MLASLCSTPAQKNMHFGAINLESSGECKTGFKIYDCSDLIEGSTIIPHEMQVCVTVLTCYEFIFHTCNDIDF